MRRRNVWEGLRVWWINDSDVIVVRAIAVVVAALWFALLFTGVVPR